MHWYLALAICITADCSDHIRSYMKTSLTTVLKHGSVVKSFMYKYVKDAACWSGFGLGIFII